MSLVAPTRFESTLGLFWGHVAGRADDRVGPGQFTVGVEDLGQAEVGHLGRPMQVEQRHWPA